MNDGNRISYDDFNRHTFTQVENKFGELLSLVGSDKFFSGDYYH